MMKVISSLSIMPPGEMEYSPMVYRSNSTSGKKIYSEYTKAGDIRFSDSYGQSYCGDYRVILEKESDIILLDTIEGTIRIRGDRLTSKDIHSQNSTIDMLSILLEHMGETVSNSRLPLSTYSQNKNELLSKVVLPIKKLSKKYF